MTKFKSILEDIFLFIFMFLIMLAMNLPAVLEGHEMFDPIIENLDINTGAAVSLFEKLFFSFIVAHLAFAKYWFTTEKALKERGEID